jgi:hypothetical protein
MRTELTGQYFSGARRTTNTNTADLFIIGFFLAGLVAFGVV